MQVKIVLDQHVTIIMNVFGFRLMLIVLLMTQIVTMVLVVIQEQNNIELNNE